MVRSLRTIDPVYWRTTSLFGLKITHGAPICPHMGVPRRTKAKPRTTRSREGMHSCPECSSALVQPVNWHEQGEGNWTVELRCPECEWWGTASYSQDEVDRYDEELDRGGQELIEDLRALI